MIFAIRIFLKTEVEFAPPSLERSIRMQEEGGGGPKATAKIRDAESTITSPSKKSERSVRSAFESMITTTATPSSKLILSGFTNRFVIKRAATDVGGGGAQGKKKDRNRSGSVVSVNTP